MQNRTLNFLSTLFWAVSSICMTQPIAHQDQQYLLKTYESNELCLTSELEIWRSNDEETPCGVFRFNSANQTISTWQGELVCVEAIEGMIDQPNIIPAIWPCDETKTVWQAIMPDSEDGHFQLLESQSGLCLGHNPTETKYRKAYMVDCNDTVASTWNRGNQVFELNE